MNAYSQMVLHGFSSKTKRSLCGVSHVFLLGFRINLSCTCRVRVKEVQSCLCRLAPSLLNELWGNIQQLQVQKLSLPQSSTNKISNCYGRMDMEHKSWYLICACMTLKTVLDEKQPNITPLYHRHVQTYLYIDICNICICIYAYIID